MDAQHNLIAQVRAADANRVRASRAGDRAWVQRSVYELARLAPMLADALERISANPLAHAMSGDTSGMLDV